MVTGPANVELTNSWARAFDPIAVGNALYDMFTHDVRSDVALPRLSPAKPRPSAPVPLTVVKDQIFVYDGDRCCLSTPPI